MSMVWKDGFSGPCFSRAVLVSLALAAPGLSDPGLAENLPLPEFSRGGVAIDPAELTRAPLDYPLVDALFSSVFEAAARFANPLGKY